MGSERRAGFNIEDNREDIQERKKGGEGGRTGHRDFIRRHEKKVKR